MRSSVFTTRFTILAAFFSVAFNVSAQEQTQRFSGVISDQQGKPLAHARVHIHGRQQYVYADDQGNFSIVAPVNAELHISASGYGDRFVILAAAQPTLSVSMTQGGIERVVVSASGIHKNNIDMATPVSMLTGEELSRRTEPTIGETLKYEPGVHANYYGPVASSPIIRGLDGPRVKVLNNGMDTGDVSRVGPDHAISADAITAQQIEILRGPATLLYGSGAIGGVVNVVDNRIPRQLRSESETKVEARYADVSDETTLSFNHEGSQDSIAWHFDGFDRDTSDYDVPRFTNDEGETLSTLSNSWLQSTALNGGLSYVADTGLIGVSLGRLESDYGIPGHDHAADSAADNAEAPGVFAKLRQNRAALAGEWYNPINGLETLSLSAAYTDYQHQEIEDGSVGTTFKNKALESRVSLEHVALAGWHGLVGYHLQYSDYQAIGDEAFTPDSKTQSHAVFMLEEQTFNNITAQLGARLEHVSLDAYDVVTNEDIILNAINYDFTAFSASAGAVWQFVPGFSWALAYSHSERAPSAAEIYSNGAHIATSSYELGLLYSLTDDGELSMVNSRLEKETANNIDLTFRSFNGDLTFTYNFFYNKVNDYLYQADTGFTLEDLAHDHATEMPGEVHDEHNDIPVYNYQQDDATLYGLEFEAKYQLDNAQSIQVFVDTVRAKLDNAGYLPRIPPYKTGLNYQYKGISWSADLGVTRYARQRKVADNETQTKGYMLIDADINYDFNVAQYDLTAFLRATNLTNELAFVHSSFIKDDAPLPGRAITLGLRARF